MPIHTLILIIAGCIAVIMFSVIFIPSPISVAFPVGERSESTQKRVKFFILSCITALLGLVAFQSFYDATHPRTHAVEHQRASRVVPEAKTAFDAQAGAVVPAVLLNNSSMHHAKSHPIVVETFSG